MRYFLVLIILLTSCKNAVTHHMPSPIDTLHLEKSVLTYEQTKSSIDSIRKELAKHYTTGNDSIKKIILATSGVYLFQIISHDLFNYWAGTPWDFNGITNQPGQGTIACGYFVSTMVRDAGYHLNRIKLSTCPSMIMMKELTSAKSIQNLSRLNDEQFISWLRVHGAGVYIIGLDFHTGFILSDGADAWFLHSNYINKKGVMKEKLNESMALKASKTKYITSLTNDTGFLRRWLLR